MEIGGGEADFLRMSFMIGPSLDGVGVSVGESGEVDADVGPGLFEAWVDAVAGALVDAIWRHVGPEEEGLPADGDGRRGGGQGGDRALEVALPHPAPGSHAETRRDLSVTW